MQAGVHKRLQNVTHTFECMSHTRLSAQARAACLHRCLEPRVVDGVRLACALKGEGGGGALWGKVHRGRGREGGGEVVEGRSTRAGTVSNSAWDRLEQNVCTRLPASARKRFTNTYDEANCGVWGVSCAGGEVCAHVRKGAGGYLVQLALHVGERGGCIRKPSRGVTCRTHERVCRYGG